MRNYNDGEWRYIDFFPLEQSIIAEPVKTRCAGGMLWFDKFEMASLMGWRVHDTRRYVDELESRGELAQEHIAIFEDKTPEGRKFNTKCYSAKIFQQLCDTVQIEDDQRKMWVLSKSGLDSSHNYEKHVLALMKKNDEIESKYRYNIVDFLWYHGEKVKEAGGRSDGYFVLLYYMIFSIVPVAYFSPQFLPLAIAFVLIMALVCVLLFSSRQRRWAIKVHYGLNLKKKTAEISSKDGIFVAINLFSWIAWWTMLAVLIK